MPFMDVDMELEEPPPLSIPQALTFLRSLTQQIIGKQRLKVDWRAFFKSTFRFAATFGLDDQQKTPHYSSPPSSKHFHRRRYQA